MLQSPASMITDRHLSSGKKGDDVQGHETDEKFSPDIIPPYEIQKKNK